VIALWLLGCTGSVADTADTCAEVPVLDWADVGEPLLLEYCDSCHTATSPDRQGAPESVTFDTYEQVVTFRAPMLAAIEGDPPAMPPLLTMPENEHALFVSWLECDVR
jgi:hypothetical protein